MQYRLTRPQLRRELTHALLVTRAAVAAARKHVAEIALAGWFLLMIGVAVFGGGVEIDRPAAPPAAATAEPPAAATAAPTPAPGTATAPATAPEAPRTHRVAPGDTLAAIALHHGVGYELIAAENGLTDPDLIVPGRTLRIPEPAPGFTVIEPGDTLSAHAERAGLGIDRLLELNPHIADPDHITAGGRLRVSTP